MKRKLLSLALVAAVVIGCFSGCKKKVSKDDGLKLTGADATYAAMNAIEFTEAMGNGINLGNTMEAYGHQTLGINAAVSAYETSWGMPYTTKEMIQGMKDAGFDSLRVPVAWTNMMDFENGNYTINQKYLDRVKEIIGYAVEADMIVIVNDHWDGGWWGMFGSKTEATREKAMTLFTEMWTQIANQYKDIGYQLVFESGNEEMGNRFNDNTEPWNKDSGSLSKDECYALANQLNQKFVDIMRSSGGYNADRFLLIAGYNTNIADTCDARYKMPTDTAKDRLLLSVHYYDPSAYCIESGISSWGTLTDLQSMNSTLESLKKFTDAGVGVVIGEWGVLIEGKSELKANTVEYFTNFIANCEVYGYCPVLWDCNSLYSRKECKIIYDEIATFFKEKSYSQVQKDVDKVEIVGLAKRAINKALQNPLSSVIIPDDEAIAWIMFNGNDYACTYRVGDNYPDGTTAGIVATDVKVEGAGTYTVSLDFTGTGTGYAKGTAFSAVGILHGETLFPGYYMEIKEVLINGEAYTLKGKPYTTSDDSICTRVNLYNGWVTILPDGARVADGDLTGCTASIIEGGDALGQIKTISVTFEYIAP